MSGTRAGFIALAGRPNAGKSTLVNRIVGDKVAIVSDKPQTTRREIRGIATGDDWQLVLVDLPGVQRPRDPMTERMQRRVEHALGDADAVLFMLNGVQRIGPGDEWQFADACDRRLEKRHRIVVPRQQRADFGLQFSIAAAGLTEVGIAQTGVETERFIEDALRVVPRRLIQH